jgi:hypothetical protein
MIVRVSSALFQTGRKRGEMLWIHIQDHLHSTKKRIADELASSQRHLLIGHGDDYQMSRRSVSECPFAGFDGSI